MKRKLLTITLLFAAILLLSTAASAAAEVGSGWCGGEDGGTNLSWTLDSDGLLTITGTGTMADYSYTDAAPWYDCRSSITAVEISPGVKSIGEEAFYNCSNLTDITIPSGVTDIGNAAFYNCSSLTDITIPSGVTSIGDCAFSDCRNLENVEIPSSVTCIGDQAFAWCSSLTSMTIPSSVASIGSQAFYSCTALTALNMGGKVIDWGSQVVDRTDLQHVYVDEYEIACCTDYKSVLPNWVTITYNKQISGNVMQTWDVSSGAIRVELYSDGTLTVLGNGAMPTCPETSRPWEIKRVVIGEGITSIGAYSFYSYSGIESVSLPTTLTSIGTYAFCKTALTSVTFANRDALSLGEYAFYCCWSLADIDFGGGIIYPAIRVFSDCDALVSVHVPGNVVMNGSYNGAGSGYDMFYSCDKLAAAVVECAYVGPFMFESDYALKSVTFTNPDVAFYYLEHSSGHPFNASRSRSVSLTGCSCSDVPRLASFGSTSWITLTFTPIANDNTHSYGTPTYTWREGTDGVWRCTAQRECTRSSYHTESETVTGIYSETTPATTAANGEGKYTATFTNPAFSQLVKTVVLPMLQPDAEYMLSGSTLMVNAHNSAIEKVIAVCYGNDGKFLSCVVGTVQNGSVSLVIDTAMARECKLFLLDSTYCPVAQALRLTDTQYT